MKLDNLPDDIETLKKLVLAKDHEIRALQDIVNLLQRKKYAPQSEIVSSNQLGLFNEIEENILEDDKAETEEETETITYERKKRGKRGRLPDSLPREEVIIDLSDEEKFCAHDGTPLQKIGEEISEQLEIIPAKVFIRKTIRPKYSCPCCEQGVKTAPVPKTLLPKSMASASLIAYIIVAKFMDALPLYRQEVIFARIGALLTRQSMARWLIKVSEKLIPLYNLLQERMLETNYIQMDETPVQVLREEGKKATTKSYMWVRHAPGLNPIVLYDYYPNRSGNVPLELLQGFEGHLQCDGYDGYAPACEHPKVTRLGCMDHSRRKFRDAFKTSGGKGTGKKALVYMKKLYKIEDQIRDFAPEKKRDVRQSKSKPILEEMKVWLEEVKNKTAPKSVAAKAVSYTLNEWNYLVGYLEDGHLNISNTWVENKIRPFAIGRKNWLFSTSAKGASASAMYYSLVETAKANGLNPFDYINEMLDKLPHAETVEDYEELLPFSKN